LELEFIFDPDINRIDNGTIRHAKRGRYSELIMRTVSRVKSRLDERTYSNPIESGMPIVVIIQSAINHYIININQGEDIYYPHVEYPPWAINRVEVSFLNNPKSI